LAKSKKQEKWRKEKRKQRNRRSKSQFQRLYTRYLLAQHAKAACITIKQKPH